jgi:hypothetical protein
MSEEKKEADGYNEIVEMVTEVSSKEAATHSEPKETMRDAYGRFAANAEKQDEDALDKLLGTVQVLDDVQPEEKPEAKAKGTKEGKETSKEAESKISQRALDKARKALELDGWGEEDFEDLSEQRIVALGKKASERQAKISQELEAKSKQRASEDGEAGEDGTSTARVAKKAEPESQVEDDAASELKPIEELFGEETSAAIAKYVQKALGLTKQQMQLVQQQIEAANEDKAERAATEARTQLTDKYPELTDDDVYEEVVTSMTELAKIPGKYKDFQGLMEAACRLNGLEFKSAKSGKSSAVQAAKSNGTPVTRTQKAPAKSLSLSDREDAALDAIFSGRGRNGARTAWDGL